MNFKTFFVFFVCIIGLTLANPMPWIQGPGKHKFLIGLKYLIFEEKTRMYAYVPKFTVFSELALPREIDPENPIMRHPDDCKVYYIFNFPMTCGEGTAFSEELKACVTEEEAGC